MSACRDFACSIHRVGIALRMIRPFQADRAASARFNAEHTCSRAAKCDADHTMREIPRSSDPMPDATRHIAGPPARGR